MGYERKEEVRETARRGARVMIQGGDGASEDKGRVAQTGVEGLWWERSASRETTRLPRGRGPSASTVGEVRAFRS